MYSRVAEVQLLGESHKVAQLAQLHVASPPAIRLANLRRTLEDGRVPCASQRLALV
jgi:hypothetical protein